MSRKKIVYLIGFMGSGKTTAGKKLASSLGWSFTDLDRKIEEDQGMTIPEIFTSLGEERFREIESELLRTFSRDEYIVVSTGGGVPCFADNMKFMLETGLTVYLKLTPGQLASRLNTTTGERPLLKGLQGDELLKYIRNKLEERSLWYEKSEVVIDGFSADIETLVKIIRKSLKF
jgi:shikimate kinase